MPQLTELSIFHTTILPLLELPPGMLTHFPRLRKLKLHRVDWTAQALAELKQLSELRELSFASGFMQNVELVAVCAPPHSLQLESIKIEAIAIDEMAMRALLYLPTLTALEATEIEADAWPLLPQLPLLRRLSFNPSGTVTPELTASLAAALSGCQALVDLSLPHVGFEEAVTEEQRSARWAQILSSVPNLHRLHVAQKNVLPQLVALLPAHAPLLEHLSLNVWESDSAEARTLLAQLTHPSVREIQLVSWGRVFSERQVQALQRRLVHSARMPNLERVNTTEKSKDAEFA
jgi:hypothetical protein